MEEKHRLISRGMQHTTLVKPQIKYILNAARSEHLNTGVSYVNKKEPMVTVTCRE